MARRGPDKGVSLPYPIRCAHIVAAFLRREEMPSGTVEVQFEDAKCGPARDLDRSPGESRVDICDR